MIRNSLITLLFLVWVPILAFAQPSNDECINAIQLPSVERYCSDRGEFTIEGATPSGFQAPVCWRNAQHSHDVWFRFTAIRTSVRITVLGRTSINAPGGSLNEPEAALYSGSCLGIINTLECETDLAGNNTVELFQGQLVIGDDYLIRVDARAMNTGTFQICVDQTNPPVLADADCVTGAILCDKSSILVEKTEGQGLDPNEMNEPCFMSVGEFDSKWFKFKCAVSGSLTFDITPNNPIDDIDFIVIEIPDLDDCSQRTLLRCMASGEDPALFPSRCHGPTGLAVGNSDISEPAGCNGGPEQNNYLAPLDMEAGKTYALGISNFSQSGSGFTIDFGGTGEFQGPEADFLVDPTSGLKCDEIFSVTDLSTFGNIGNITGWEWNFGSGATPQMSSDQGPHNVGYNSFGPKTISLTITTDLGCQVTTIKNIMVEPCCEDLDDLILNRDSVINLLCGGDSTGVIFLSAEGGSPEYLFGLLGEQLSELGQINNLPAGNHEVVVQDIKGCMDTILVRITEPEPLKVNAGADRTIKLGDCIDIEGRVTPLGRETSYEWTGGGEGDIQCDTCAKTKVIPTMGTSTYIISVRDSLGCEDKDTITVIVEIVRPYFAPNVISPNGDGLNDVFTIYGGAGLQAIITLEVYDRWGELVYRGENFPPGDQGIEMGFGWDGRFHDQNMMPGVFAFRATLEYIDDVSITAYGDFTILR